MFTKDYPMTKTRLGIPKPQKLNAPNSIPADRQMKKHISKKYKSEIFQSIFIQGDTNTYESRTMPQ